MADQAKVRSIEALRAFKNAMKEFDEAVRLALGEAQQEVQRAAGWLQSDRVIYWKQQLRLRQNRLSDAKSELMRAKLATDTRTSAIVERKNVAKWTQAVEEAERKLENIKKWSRMLDHEISKFKSHCQPLSRIVDGDFPKAYAQLDRYYATLEKYLRIVPPSGGGPIGTGSTAPSDDSNADDEKGAESGEDSGYAGGS